MGKKALTNCQKLALADPATLAAMDRAKRMGDQRFGSQLAALAMELKAIRKPLGADAVQFMALRARFDALAIEQKHYTEAVLADLLNPGNGTEMVDA